MKILLAQIKAHFWAALGVLTVVGLILFAILRLLFTKGPVLVPGKLIPDPPQALLDRKAQAEENALVLKATSQAQTDVKKVELANITKIDDGKERRKRLADFLSSA